MNELSINHQVVYYHEKNAIGVSMNLLSFGFRLFMSTARVKKIELLKKLCDEFDENKPPNPKELGEFAFENLLDSIKISICFENFMKSILLLNGFVIHKLDKNIFPDLYELQFKRPIPFSEIRQKATWEINPSIRTEEVG